MNRLRPLPTLIASCAIATLSWAPLCAQSAAPLTITTASPLSPGRVSVVYTATLAADGGAQPYRWAASGNIPPGLALNPATGVLSGIPATRGSYTFAVQVTDGIGQTATKVISLTINTPPLAITTEPPLFAATVGIPYSQPFTVANGTPPYRWTLSSGAVAGLTLDQTTGDLAGTPSVAGSFNLSVQVADRGGETAVKTFVLVVNVPTLTITTGSALPKGTVGTAYTVKFTASGGTAPFTWSMPAGRVPGLQLDATNGVLSETPTDAGTFTFAVQVKDSTGLTATKTFTLAVSPASLSIKTGADLPGGRIGEEYSYQMEASGGVPPYNWSANGLPEGLTLDSGTGALSGTPATPGSISFNVRVTDAARTTSVALFRISIETAPLPAVTIAGPPATGMPASQYNVRLELDRPYPVPLSGQLQLSFAPDTGGGDATIQFSTGGRSARFHIGAGQTKAEFDAGDLAMQTGTVAGRILLNAQIEVSGVDITPAPAPSFTVRIDRAAPSISKATFSKVDKGVEIQFTAFSTTRELVEATFQFSASPGSALQQQEVRVPLDTAAAAWFQDAANSRFGSQFTFTQQFTIQGDLNAVTPVSVTLTNREGKTQSPLKAR